MSGASTATRRLKEACGIGHDFAATPLRMGLLSRSAQRCIVFGKGYDAQVNMSGLPGRDVGPAGVLARFVRHPEPGIGYED